MGRTHLAAGLALAAAGTLVPETLINQGLFGLAAVFGSLLPDLDHPKSKLGRIMLPISLPLNLIFGHRGGTHSLLFVTLCLIPVVFSPSVGLGLAIGVLLHIVLDVISHSSTWYRTTAGGCPLLYPLTKKRYAIKAVKVGSPMEKFVVLPAFFSLGVVLSSLS